MRSSVLIVAAFGLLTPLAEPVFAQRGAAAPQAQVDPAADPIRVLVDRLDLEKYKATIKGLTQFGDRREGTDRNRAAIDWIEAQLKSYGCPTERLEFSSHQPAGRGTNTTAAGGQAGGARGGAQSAQPSTAARGRPDRRPTQVVPIAAGRRAAVATSR